MDTKPRHADDGSATIEPSEPVVAGSFGTWRLIYEAGAGGLPVGARIRIGTDSDTDWGIPQFVDPAAAESMTAEAPQGVQIQLQTESVKTVRLTLHGRGLKPGGRITIVYGDRSGGGPGSRAQTFAEAPRNFIVSVDAEGTGQWVRLDDSPRLAVVGDDAVRLVVLAPSTIAVGEEFRLLVKAEDQWGNQSHSYRGTVDIRSDGIDGETRRVTFTPDDCGTRWVDGFRATETGVHSIVCRDDDQTVELCGESNPMVVVEQSGGERLYWADPHGGQVVLNSKIGDFFRHARDVAGVQFVGYQRNADVLSQEDWLVQQRQEREFYEPGRFVPIPGYEWSGRTWHGGHHNIYFRRHDQPVRRNSPAETDRSVDQSSELPHIQDVYNLYRNADVVITPHVGGEHSNLEFHEPLLEPAVEITSSHGSFEWMLRESLERGYQLGFLGGSDSYTGRPGDDRPGFQLRRYSKAGLTGIYTNDVTLAGFMEAMRARRVYATTGVRMVLHVAADGHPLGSKYSTAAPPTIAVSVIGTAPLESVELFRGLERIHKFQPETRAVPNRVRLLCSGASRMTSYSGVVWDGLVKVSGGAIASVETIRFDSPRSRVVEQSTDALRWQAWGCGYPMGLTLDLDGNDEIELQVSVATQTMTGPAFGLHGEKGPRRISFAPAETALLRIRLSDLEDGPKEVDLGPLDRKLTVSLDTEPGPQTVRFQQTDRSPRPGINPYWIRVVQRDMNMGWTSPVFVDFVSTE